VERLEKSAKDMIEKLDNSADEKAKADPTNKKKIKEEFKENKTHVNNFKDNTKKQMKEILSTLKQNPGVNKFLYKKAFEKEFDNFMEKMSLLLSGIEVTFPKVTEKVKNIVIEFGPENYSQTIRSYDIIPKNKKNDSYNEEFSDEDLIFDLQGDEEAIMDEQPIIEESFRQPRIEDSVEQAIIEESMRQAEEERMNDSLKQALMRQAKMEESMRQANEAKRISAARRAEREKREKFIREREEEGPLIFGGRGRKTVNKKNRQKNTKRFKK
jgi:hypothetical protein